MKCRANKPKAESRNTILTFILHAIALAMLDSGYTAEETKRLMDKINYTADSIIGDYVGFADIKKALKEEYGFEINLH